MKAAVIRKSVLFLSLVAASACATDKSTSPAPVTPTTPAPVSTISLDSSSINVYAGVTRQVKATVKDAGGTSLTDRPITWTSTDTTTATVSGSGLISSRRFGTATVTASVEGKTASVVVRVKHDPIVFVHGFASSGAIWSTMKASLVADGWIATDMLAWSYDASQSNVTTAQQLKTRVDSIVSASGAPKVDIISHSMGALSARYYAGTLGGAARIQDWVSLGGPNHGTSTANFCSAQSCVEMRPGSVFLAALNAGDETPGSPRYATWWTPCDIVTTPPESVILSGATNTQTACLDHSELYRDATVYAQVRDWIR